MSRRRTCDFYQRPGGCRRGGQCQFLHEGSSSPSSSQNGSRPQTSSAAQRAPPGKCHSFWTTGQCRFGFDCRYDHVRQGEQGANNFGWRPTGRYVFGPSHVFAVSSSNSTSSDLTAAQVHNHIKSFLADGFRFNRPNEIYAFVSLLGNAVKENHWSVEDGQLLLTTIATPGQNGLLRLGDIIRYPEVDVDVGVSLTRLSFQRAYIPLLMYFASNSVVKSTIHHDVNSLYALINNNVEDFANTVTNCMARLMENRSFKDPNASQNPSYLTGNRVWPAISTVIFEYITRFRHAVARSPIIAALVRKLDECFVAWMAGIDSTPPTFEDDWAKETTSVQHFFTKYLQEQVSRLVTIVNRERPVQRPDAGRITPNDINGPATAAILAYLEVGYDAPGALRREGPRHDNDFSDISEIRIAPTHNELNCPIPPCLPANIPDAPHHLPPGMGRLLDIQFRLLREELIAPVRVAIQCVFRDLAAPKHQSTMLASLLHKNGGRYIGSAGGNNRIMFPLYTNCVPTSIDFHPYRGVVVELALDTPPGSARSSNPSSRVKFWEGKGGRRLMQGGLIALIWGSGDTVKAYLGIVTSSPKDLSTAARQSEDRIKIQINFFDSEVELRTLRGLRKPSDNERTPRLLIEAPVMFETIRPFLRALRAEPTSLPFAKYLIPANSLEDVTFQPPKYALSPGFSLNLACLFNEQRPGPLLLRADDPTSVEHCREELRLANSKLDPSQADSLVDSLTREVALIQGPPGTGKTYIGIELLRVLKKNNIGPILMIAFTNHALDHMLAAVLDSDITKKIVRLGSRSADERVSKFNLDTLEMAQSQGGHSRTGLDNTLSGQFRSLKQTQEKLKHLMTTITGRRMDGEKIQEYMAIHYSDLYESLLRPPLWVLRLRRDASLFSEWETVGHPISKTDLFTYWEEARDLNFLRSQSIVNLRKASKVSSASPANRFATLAAVGDTGAKEEDSDSDTEGDDIESDMNIDIAASWLRSWPTDNVSPGVENGEKDVLPDAPQPLHKEDNDSGEIPSLFNPIFDETDIPVIPSTRRIIDDLLLPRVDMWTMSRQERSALSCFWKEEVAASVVDEEAAEFSSLRTKYEDDREHYNEIKDQIKLQLLDGIDIVGCTTTGASKFNSLLKSFSPKVLLVEEAGQVLEAHVLGSLVPSIEHLILIGDPLQLRPNIANYNLSIDSKRGQELYRFDMSLMERLFRSGLPMSQLEVQRRMRPSISSLIRRNTLYRTLQDHQSTTVYPDVRGMGKNVFFMTHEHKETGGGEDSVSKHNVFEVDMTVELVVYLLKQACYSGDGDIVVLCAYLGQLVRMRDALAGKVITLIDERDEELLAAQEVKDDESEEPEPPASAERVPLNKKVLLRTVDNFQGEEAKIVILSLVRNSGSLDDEDEKVLLGVSQPSIGFLKSNNRTNVALSRAQHGLYILGNATDLAQKSSMWENVLTELEEKKCLGAGFPIICPKHPDQRQNISKPDMFAQVAPDGGCLQPCGISLKCGHICPYKCHSDDPNHVSIPCRERCLRLCPQGHPCNRLCSQDCGNCKFPVPNVTLLCGHVSASIPCYLSRDLVNVNCQQMVKKSYSACEHSRMVKCSEDVSSEKCRENCGTYLTCCGRNCQSSCSDCQDLSPRNAENSLIQRTSHGRHPCRKVLFCGHPCQEGCSENHECTKKCMKQCQRSCRHSVCAKACHIVCAPCAEPCSWECPHAGRCPLPCGSICLRLPCDERCTKVLPCGHLCLSLCGEPCGICGICASEDQKNSVVDLIMQTTLGELEAGDALENLIMTLSCGHTFTVESLDGHCEMDRLYTRNENSSWSGLVDLSSSPGFRTAPTCPLCRTPISIPRYGRAYKRAALDLAELNIASDMTQSLAKVQAGIALFNKEMHSKFVAQSIKDISKPFFLSPKHQRQAVAHQTKLLKEAEANKQPVHHRDLWLFGGKKNKFNLPVPLALEWRQVAKPLLNAYELSFETALKRPAHVVAYENAFSTLFQMELEGLLRMSDGGPKNPHENAMRIAKLKMGRPPPRADKRFCVEAIWWSVKIRLEMGEIGESMLKSMHELKTCPKTVIFLWGNFLHFIYSSCQQDILLALNIAVGSESRKQIVTSTLLQLQTRFELCRFDVAMWNQQTHTSEEREELATEVEKHRNEGQSLIASTRRTFLSQSPGQSEWLAANFLTPTSSILEQWDELRKTILGGTFYTPVSREELIAVVGAFQQEFTHTGHWYTCLNGHTYSIGECGGAMERAVCPECGEAIGGMNHNLEGSNQRATEMENILWEQGAAPSPWRWGRDP